MKKLVFSLAAFLLISAAAMAQDNKKPANAEAKPSAATVKPATSKKEKPAAAPATGIADTRQDGKGTKQATSADAKKGGASWKKARRIKATAKPAPAAAKTEQKAN
ncbi:MAG: hypothetical protein FD123_1438 [Bacteroidetes bacterium]|nr:MAG: hypothetical protein FD123_1438 [Bacteroidota bacterium]